MSEKNKMTSIARKINLEFWTAQFSNYIMLDLLIFIIVLVSFLFSGRVLFRTVRKLLTGPLRVTALPARNM